MAKIEELYIGFLDKKAIIKIVGHGNMNVSPTINQLFEKLIEEDITDIIFDLSECEYVDSTCIGTFCNITVKLNRSFNKKATLLAMNEHVEKSIALLHVFPLFNLVTEEIEEHFEIKNIEIDNSLTKKERAEHMLEAHQTLIDVNSKNKITFQNVVKYLKESISS